MHACMGARAGYPKYNVVAKKLYRRLEGLGAQLVAPLGLGDDQHRAGYEAALDPWLPQLWAALRARFPLPLGVTEVKGAGPVAGPAVAGGGLGCRCRAAALSAGRQGSLAWPRWLAGCCGGGC